MCSTLEISESQLQQLKQTTCVYILLHFRHCSQPATLPVAPCILAGHVVTEPCSDQGCDTQFNNGFGVSVAGVWLLHALLVKLPLPSCQIWSQSLCSRGKSLTHYLRCSALLFYFIVKKALDNGFGTRGRAYHICMFYSCLYCVKSGSKFDKMGWAGSFNGGWAGGWVIA